ncbi:hypothetical protein BpHYR1_018289 [Brachionus plicatilis]|uniref:Uncharacterized protein n=1 Tax=Brachionus plicatilis TaxID=10195 RepID=A0A3M7PA82_BRAPC|nr:hypothetical protein BpHYR1_018289 [Brachionus plicatilis]
MIMCIKTFRISSLIEKKGLVNNKTKTRKLVILRSTFVKFCSLKKTFFCVNFMYLLLNIFKNTATKKNKNKDLPKLVSHLAIFLYKKPNSQIKTKLIAAAVDGTMILENLRKSSLL